MEDAAIEDRTGRTDDFAARETLAIKNCEDQIVWYHRHSKESQISSSVLQLVAVALSAATPVLLLIDLLPKWLQGLPAAVAAVLGVVITTVQLRESWARFATSEVALKAELLRYRTRTTQRYAPGVSEQQRLDSFVARLTAIEQTETQQWQLALETAASTQRPPRDGSTAKPNPAGRRPGNAQ